MKRFLVFIILCCFIIPELVAKGPNKQIQLFDSLAIKISSISFSKGAEARKILNELYSIANQCSENTELKKRCLYHETSLNYAQGIYDSTLLYRIQTELNSIDKQKDEYYYALLQYAFSLTQLTKGNYAEAFTAALYVVDFAKQIKDSTLVLNSFCLLGRICSYVESYSMAENYYKQAKNYAHPNKLEYYQTSSNIYSTWETNMDEAIDSLKSLIPAFRTLQDTGSLASTYLNVGFLYFMQNKADSTRSYYFKAEELSHNVDNKIFLTFLYQNIGAYYFYLQDFEQSYYYYLLSRSQAAQAQNPSLLIATLPTLANYHEQTHRIDSAYYYLKEYASLRTQISQANPIGAYQAYISVFLEASQKELTIKEQEILLKNRRFSVFIISGISILLLIFSWVIILQQQKRHILHKSLLKEAENKDLEEKLQNKLQIEHLQKAYIEAQIRELTSSSLALSTKNDILQQISTTIQRIRGNRDVVKEIEQIIKNNLNTNKTWDDFVLHFNKVHPDFFNRIKAHSSTISGNDLKLCAYLWIGLSTKQIAQMLNVSTESIWMHRYRIKKKLNLGEDQSLDDFIRNI